MLGNHVHYLINYPDVEDVNTLPAIAVPSAASYRGGQLLSGFPVFRVRTGLREDSDEAPALVDQCAYGAVGEAHFFGIGVQRWQLRRSLPWARAGRICDHPDTNCMELTRDHLSRATKPCHGLAKYRNGTYMTEQSVRPLSLIRLRRATAEHERTLTDDPASRARQIAHLY